MNAWLKAVASKISFFEDVSIHFVVDLDGIIRGDIQAGLAECGWRIVVISDEMVLRHLYESFVQGIPLLKQDLYVLRLSFDSIPFDVKQNAQLTVICFGDFFPKLNVDALKIVPDFWLASIYENQPLRLAKRTSMSYCETIQFIMQDCLAIVLPDRLSRTQLIKLAADVLLRGIEIPAEFIRCLPIKGNEKELKALTSIVVAKDLFHGLWHSYNRYIDCSEHGVAESDSLVESIDDEMFQDHDLQSRFTALIQEGIIPLLKLRNPHQIPDWLTLGIHYDVDQQWILEHRLDQLTSQIPENYAFFEDWGRFAYQWAEYSLQYFQSSYHDQGVQNRYHDLHLLVEEKFSDWLKDNYQSQMQQPYLPKPTMVQQVLHYLAAQYKPNLENPLALIIVDGMSIEDWVLIRSYLNQAEREWNYSEKAIMAFIPTITAISRMALLSGKLPVQLGHEIASLVAEPKYWEEYWLAKGIQRDSISYLKNLGVHSDHVSRQKLEPELLEIINTPTLSIAALIVNTIDHMMHANVLGPSELTAQLTVWAGEIKYLEDMITRLLTRFSNIVITSDHGHIFGSGIGDLFYPSLSEERALRVRLIKGEEYKTIAIPKGIIQWPAIGLPEGYNIFVPDKLGLFEKSTFSGVSHGGVSLEECVIPFIEITR